MALAAPAEMDGFSYAGDSLYREASNFNRHRRATLPELKAHFNGKDTDNNRPAHWYEAQLLHYGLPPSKVKGTAHKRLFDAVMKGGLTVPSHIQKIEADLKKEWTKREREVKKMVKGSAAASEVKKGAKRKADQVSTSTNVSVNVSVQIGRTGKVTVQAAQPAAKKAKTAPAAAMKDKKTVPAKSTAAAVKKTKNAPAVAVKDKKTTPAKSAAAAATPKTRIAPALQTARKTATPKKTTTPKAAKAAPKATHPTKLAKTPVKGMTKPIQMARRSHPLPSGTATGFAMNYGSFHKSGSQDSQQSSPYPSKLGLINGRYTVRSDDLNNEFYEYNSDFGFIATLDGDRLWLKFDFGAAAGIMELERPWGVLDGRRHTIWRGSAPDEYGDQQFVNPGADDDNWVEFLGDGCVRGSISWDGHKAYRFDAEHLPDQPTSSEIHPFEMRRMFDDYHRY